MPLGARVKLIQCMMNRMKEGFSSRDPPQLVSGGSRSGREGDAVTTRKVS